MKKKEMKISKNPEKAKKLKKGKSKFSNKYSERIASIREADERTKRKMANRKKEKKTPQQLRNEMLEQLKNSKLK